MFNITADAKNICQIISVTLSNNNNSKGEPICTKEFAAQLQCCFCPL